MFGAMRRVLAGLTIVIAPQLATAQAGVLQVTPAGGETFSQGLAEKAAAIKALTKVERYLLIKTQPHDVIGVEADAPLRILTGDGKIIEAELESGKKFRKQDNGKNVAIIGNIYAEDYGYGGGMGAMGRMKHRLSIGQTFKLTGEEGPRVRVLGSFSAKPEREAQRVFVPLTTAQKLFNRSGQLSHLFVTVKGDADAAAKELEKALGPGARVKPVSQ